MKFCRIIFCLWLLVCFFPIGIHADIQLPSILSDNMVLQQNAKVRFWGKARPGEKILVKTSWDHKKYKVTALANGHWELMIQTPAATSGQSVMLKGDNKIRINNILIGEVWLCTGQSNMEFPVARNPQVKWKTGMLNEAEEMKDADFPEIRLFHVEHQLAPDGEKEDCVGKWVVCNPENLKDFSAVGFVFGRKLYKELSTPVGLIQSTWGGTHAESWTSMKVMENNPLYADVLKQYSKERVSREKDKCKVPATLWNGMIAPIVGYTVKGNIWYQGESNSVRYEKYQEVFTNLINSWRKEWNQPDMPFYFVQIAPHYKQPAGIREAQLKTWLSGLENIGMAVVTDAADSTDIHPRNKVAPGERLAAWALAKQYGKKIVYSGPLYKSMKVNGREITLDFEFAEGGLQTPGNEPVKGFFIAGNDARFYPADAVIDGSSITLSSTYVSAPVAVRYGYGTFFRVNLFNKAGLPAVPFRTDTFAPDTYYRLFADSEIRRFPEAWQLDHGKRLYFGYAQGVGCCAMLQVWKKTGDRRYFDYVEAWADSLVDDKGEIHLYKKETYNLDYINSGKVLFDLYKETKKEKYKLAIENLIDQLKKQPRTTDGGFWHKKIYPNQMWLDGLYMASPFMARYGAEFNRPEWIDEAVKQFTLCHQHTYDTKTGLYYHAWNEDRSQRWADPETGHSPNFWGRSIGWWFMALVDALEYIPQDHSGYADMIKWTKELAETIRSEGERAALESGVIGLNPELIKLLGKLKYRTSYGQNVLNHSIEVSNLARIMAEELGLDAKLARRAGLLHDIGKALDHDMEGTHVEIGVEILKKFKENPLVINAVEAHHGDVEPQTLEAVLVQAADAISASRPGARRETLEAYIKRLENLESIADSFDGVEKSFAIQAGREVRIIVKPEQITDADMTILATSLLNGSNPDKITASGVSSIIKSIPVNVSKALIFLPSLPIILPFTSSDGSGTIDTVVSAE